MKTSILNALTKDLCNLAFRPNDYPDEYAFARDARKLIRKAIRDDEKHKMETADEPPHLSPAEIELAVSETLRLDNR